MADSDVHTTLALAYWSFRSAKVQKILPLPWNIGESEIPDYEYGIVNGQLTISMIGLNWFLIELYSTDSLQKITVIHVFYFIKIFFLLFSSILENPCHRGGNKKFIFSQYVHLNLMSEFKIKGKENRWDLYDVSLILSFLESGQIDDNPNDIKVITRNIVRVLGFFFI